MADDGDGSAAGSERSARAALTASGYAPWAVLPTALPLSLDLGSPEAAAGRGGSSAPKADNGVMVIGVSGVALPRISEWVERAGLAFSTERLAERIEASASAGHTTVVMIDSPGGSVAGTPEAAARIAAVAQDHLVVAVSNHMIASGAYWLASQCSAIVASPSSLVGSVGVFGIRVATNRALEAMGVDAHVVSAGDGKTDSIPMVAFSEDARSRMQDVIDSMYGQFTTAVAAGRRVPRGTVVKEWGAAVYDAAAAKKSGIVDLVADPAKVLGMLSTAAGKRKFRNFAAMTMAVRSSSEGGCYDRRAT